MMNNFTLTCYDIYLSNSLKSEGRYFCNCSYEQQMLITKNYLLWKKYNFLDVLDCLKSPSIVLNFFKESSGLLGLDLPDDADEIIDRKFINFLCDFFSSPTRIFENHLVKAVENLANDAFDDFYGVSTKNYFGEEVNNDESAVYSPSFIGQKLLNI